MKKALKIFAIVIVLFIVAIIVTPIIFKGKILELAKTEANKQLNAKVDFGDIDLSLISNFPNFSLDLSDLSVIGVGEFNGDTLTTIGNIHLTLDFMSVVSGDQIKINAVTIDNPNIHVWVKENGAANYDIAKESDEVEVAEESTDTEESAPLSLNIESYAINHANISYIDETMDMSVDIRDFTHTGKGDFAEDVFTLFTQSSIAAFTMDYEGMDVLKKAEVSLKADIAMDLNAFKFTFMENLMTINSLGLGFDGWVSMPADDIDMDIKFDMAKNELLALLSLVPAEFATDLEGVDATGKVAFNGFVKGLYNDETMPGFGLNLLVDNGRIHYPDLPRSIENIQIDTKIDCPQGSADMEQLKVAVDKFYMEIGKTATQPNTVDAKMVITQAMTHPVIDAKLNANLDLGSFKDVIPMEEEFEIGGKFMADMFIAGKVDDIVDQDFNAFKAGGNASLSHFIYKDETENVSISDCKIALTPQRLDLKTLQMAYDEMNIQMSGYVEDYVLYALNDTTLVGVFDFKADKVDLNKYMTEEEEVVEVEATAEGTEVISDSAAVELFLVPNNLDVTLKAEIGQVIYDNVILDQMKGVIVIKDEIASMEDITFKTLGADIAMTGSYSTQNHEVPRADFTYDIKDLDIQKAFETFNTIEKIAPIAKYATGKLSTDLVLTTDLDAQMNPIMNSINARGNVKSKELLMEGGKFLGNLAETLKSPKLAKQKVQDLDANFVIRDGNVTTSPFNVKIDDMEATISGYSTFENEIEYLMEMEIPRDALGGDFNKMAEGLLASANAFLGGNMSMGEYIDVDVRVYGALDDPKISPSFAGMSNKDAKESVKEAVKEEIKEQIEDLKDDAREEAQKQADKLIKDAQKEADKLVKEAKKAGDQIKAEAKKQGDKLIDDAKNPFAKEAAKIGAKKLNSEADKQAKNLVKEAQKQADKGMAEARKQADDIIAKSLK